MSTVNVVKKKRAKKRKSETELVSSLRRDYADSTTVRQARTPNTPDLKESVIAQVNDKLLENEPQTEQITADADLFAESANSAGSLDLNDVPQRIDTVRLYSESERPRFHNDGIDLEAQDLDLSDEDWGKDGGRYALNSESGRTHRVKIALGVEFAAACALCGAIFLTNVFMPNSAINTFFRALDGNKNSVQTDARTYADFKLSSVVSAFADTEMNLSATGILSFTDEGHVYPVADGKVSEITQNADGTYVLKLAHSDTFTGVIGGLDRVYYEIGDEVKANVPVGYSEGETEVQVTMYSSGELLNCFELTEANCLAWVEQK